MTSNVSSRDDLNAWINIVAIITLFFLADNDHKVGVFYVWFRGDIEARLFQKEAGGFPSATPIRPSPLVEDGYG